jgi:hypothetical protein
MRFSRHILAKYRRVDVDVAVWDVVASTWMNHNSQLLLSLINTGLGAAYVTLGDLPPWVVEQNTANLYSTLDIDHKYNGRQSGDFVSLLPRSITTVVSHKPVAYSCAKSGGVELWRPHVPSPPYPPPPRRRFMLVLNRLLALFCIPRVCRF